MILWSNAAIQTRKTNRNGQEMGLLQLLRTAGQHNDIVVVTKKKNQIKCYPPAFPVFSGWIAFLCCAVPFEEEKGERQTSITQEAPGIQNIWKLLLWYRSSYFVWMTHKGKYLHTLLQTLHATSRSQGGSPAEESSMVLWWQGKVYFWREGGRECSRKEDQEGRTGLVYSFLVICAFPFITLSFLLCSPS